jgi:hypothetical protein
VSGDCQPCEQQLCDCCTGVTDETPEIIGNRPALSSIAYRVGRWATFDASMLAALSDPKFAPLGQLRTRDSSDFSIALLDAWALTLDILTFYQERFANEAFLRTAVEQRSVIELAALVGYEPSPGVAASAALAFTLSSAPGSPENVLIPAGTRVQSVPGPGQTPQVFETSSDLAAQIAWNALPAHTTLAWALAKGDTSTWIAGTANNVNVGDALLFVLEPGGTPEAADFHYVTAVNVVPGAATTPGAATSGATQIMWDRPLSSAFTHGADSTEASVYVFRKKAALYGVQAPNPETLPESSIEYVSGAPAGKSTGASWDYSALRRLNDGSQINLDASYSGLTPQLHGPPQWLVLAGTSHDYRSVFEIERAVDTNPNYFTLTTKTTQLTLKLLHILTGDTRLSQEKVIEKFVEETPAITAFIQSAPLAPYPLPLTSWPGDSTYKRQAGMLAPVARTTVSVVGGQQIAAGQPIGVSGRRLRLQVALNHSASFVPAGFASGSEAGGQVFVVDAFPPVSDPANTENMLWSVETLSGVAGSLSVPPTTSVQLQPCDPRADASVGEAAVVQSVTVAGDVTKLTLNAALSRIYDASTVSVNANAVQATNGETVQEILGSGNAVTDPLQFTLKQAPLTYLTAPSGSGAQSTLQVWVNNLQWTEAPNLLGCGPADRAFVTAANAAGSRVLSFGDGLQGARPATGTSNVRATYRKGIGSAGMVSAGQLTQPLDRPQGLSSVINPSPASGAADPATAEQARASAPLPALTIGRVVSLQDYQNFALAFAGIAKALASWTWFGDVRGVFLTVAGANGATLDGDDPILAALIEAIGLCGEPWVPLRVASYVPVLFRFSATVAVDQPTYDPDQVLAQVWQNVCAAFAFEQRDLGQSVAASLIVEIIQRVPGVVAVQLQTLGYSGEPLTSPAAPMLCAAGPAPPAGAGLLVLDPATARAIGQWS